MLRNKEFKAIMIKLIILQAILAGVGFFIVDIFMSSVNKNIIERDMAMVGSIVKDYPELKNALIPYITKNITEEDREIGREILESYGYKTEMSLKRQPVLSTSTFNIKITIPLMIVLFIIPLGYMITGEYKKIYGKVRKVAKASQQVVEGDFSIYLSEEGEGDFNILSHQFNQMANRLENNLDLLKKEKVFLRNMISDISHQLKTPLSSLIMLNEILLGEEDMPEQTRLEFLEKGRSQLVRMEWLTINLLKVARIEAGSIAFKRESVLFKDIVNASLEALEQNLKNCQVKLTGNFGASFNGDKEWTSEALINIIKNSAEHGSEDIEISLEETPLFSSIIVNDNGEGIDAAYLPHIFKRFYKAKSEIKPQSIGIGLNLAKLIVESQNGTITVRSSKGRGTQMTMTFLKGII